MGSKLELAKGLLSSMREPEKICVAYDKNTGEKKIVSEQEYHDGIAMSCGVGRRCTLDLTWLWLWHRPAATGLIQPLAWEPPYAAGVALKRLKKKKEY